MPSAGSYLHWIDIAHTVPQIGFFASTVLGSIVLFLNFCGAQNKFGPYKYIVNSSTILGMVFSIVEVIVYPNVHNYNAGFLFYTLAKPLDVIDMRLRRIFLALLNCGTFTVSIGLSGQHFAHVSVYSMRTLLLFEMDTVSIEYFREEMQYKYDWSISDIPAMALVAYDPSSGMVRWKNVAGVINITLIVMTLYGIMIFCGWSMYSEMEEKIQSFSDELKKHQKQLFKALVLQKSKYGEQLLYYRCGIVSGTYGILNVHFVFRYLTLKRNAFVNKHFMPYGLILAIMYVAAHIAIWAAVTGLCLHSAPEMRDYIREPFKALHNESFDDITFVAGLFSETTAEIAERSWTGIVLLTVIASYSIVLYIVLGYKIVTGINTKSSTMSKQTAQMQKQLFKALTIQTIIPICVSFMPCSLSFYGAALRIDFVNWVYWGAAVAVSFFPFLDPVAVTLFLPTLRKRLISFGHVDNSVHQHYSDTSVGH
ncbi:hypothetical protein L5515_006663 [Caenorhabditis briggsae]|uniref:Uncharacterized protein n=1 Tax=Caenorhabditis briggsae TaxID=6238 RepID=A0AAE9EZY9_CAEBR|nr:hypothetical protein L5515_006663 [Caenorhabditis briggsae]